MKRNSLSFKNTSVSKLAMAVLVSMLLSMNLQAQFHEIRPIGAFTKIETLGSVSVYYTNSDTTSLVVYANEKEIQNVETKLENAKLIVSNRGGKYTEPVKVYIKNNALTSIESSGASSFKTMNYVKADSLIVSVSGSASVKLKADVRSLNSIQSGASHLSLSGNSSNLFAELSGASSLSAYELQGKNVKVSTTGASSAKVFSDGKIMANAGGASTIKIKGEVKDISAEASPSSSITRIVDKQSGSKDTEGDSVIYNWKGKRIIIIDKEDSETTNYTFNEYNQDYFSGYRHWAGFSMGVNGFLNSANKTEIEKPYNYMNVDVARSFNYQFNLFENHIKLVKNKLVLVTGFGFDYHSYELENKTRLNADSSFTWGVMDSSGVYGYKKNRYRNTYIQVPLLLEFNAKGKSSKCFHMAVGVIGQYQILSRTKQVLEKDGYEIENMRKDGYNTNPFAAKAHINFGYSRWMFYGEYSLTPLFQKNKGPELYPFSIGLRIVPFG